MVDIVLFTAITCWLYSCDHRYEIYKTNAECVVALAEYRDYTPFWPFRGSHSGLCTALKVNEDEITTYKKRSVK